jgi:hypothetical protein
LVEEEDESKAETTMGRRRRRREDGRLTVDWDRGWIDLWLGC